LGIFVSSVKGLILSLKARGQRTENLLANLFKGYLARSDKVFVKYIASKIENMKKERISTRISSCSWRTTSID
jgi:hypothetical protein